MAEYVRYIKVLSLDREIAISSFAKLLSKQKTVHSMKNV